MKRSFLLFTFLVFGFGIFDLGFSLTTYDPTAISVGARALGMGRACIAMAENADTLFYNPAGLGEIDSFQFTSMSAKLLEEVNYTVLGGIYPLGEKSAIGFGIASAFVQDISLRDKNNTYLSKADYRNSVLICSLGKKFSDTYSMGLNIKYFVQDASENNNGDGNGFNLDIGLLQKGIGPFSLGLVLSNVSGQSTLTYNNGGKETLPQTLKIGTRAYLLGQRFGAAKMAQMEVFMNIDAQVDLQHSNTTATHYGLEMSPVSFLTLRAGIDQDTQTNYTSGLTLSLAGLSFNYAYHPYTQLSENASHYFSICFDERGWPSEDHPDVFIGQI